MFGLKRKGKEEIEKCIQEDKTITKHHILCHGYTQLLFAFFFLNKGATIVVHLVKLLLKCQQLILETQLESYY